MNLLYFLLASSFTVLLLDSPILGVITAVIAGCWLTVLAWQSRHMPYDPKDY